MQIHGSRLRDASAIGFDLALMAAFALHGVESQLFWTVLGGFGALCAAVCLGLTALRFIAPDSTEQWWDSY